MDDLKASLARPIQLAEQVIKWADEAQTCRQECQDLKAKLERLSTLLRQAARADLYERPAPRILQDTDKALDKAAALLERCCGHGLVRRLFTIIPAGSFKKASYLLDNSLGDLTWILRVSNYAASDEDDDHHHIGLPPIAQNEPILFLIWEQIAVLQYGGLEVRADAAASVVSLARDNDRYGRLIIEEDGVPPLLRLIKEGRAECASSSMSAAVPGPSARPVGMAGMRLHNASMSATSTRGREYEDPEIKAYLKAHAARALGTLGTGNPAICKNITESRALLCFSILLEKAMALVEICRVAEQNAELRRSAFKPTSPSARAMVDQLLRVVEKADYDDLLIPCITCLGCLSRTFRATETRVIGPFVRLLDEREADVSLEAAAALAKFACMDNYLHVDHCKSIIAHGGAKHMVQLVYFGEQVVQTAALVLVCYLAHNVPDSEDLAQAEILTVLDWAWKQGYMSQDPVIESLLPEAKIRMELYQSRVGYY